MPLNAAAKLAQTRRRDRPPLVPQGSAIDGAASPPWLGDAAQGLVDVLPEARRRTIDGQTHDVDPALLAPVLGEFFAG